MWNNYIYAMGRKRLPIVLQLPITSRCNSRCKTCNVWKYKDNIDIDYVILKEVLQDSFFSEVQAVGLNGGEFTLMPDFINVLESVLVLPRLSSIYLITNGLYPQRLFEYLQKAKSICSAKNVFLHVCISIDGVGPVHENVRGVPRCFSKTTEIINELCVNKDRYCDDFSFGCTISQYNISSIKETDSFFSQYKDISIEYHLAIPNKRIKTFDDYEDYYVLNNKEARFLAAEFFYEKFQTESNERKRIQYFVNYYFLKNGGKGRLCKCEYSNRDVTIDENLNLSLCAAASDIIGSLKEKSAYDIINSSTTRECRRMISKQCDNCIHYSYNDLSIKGKIAYVRELTRYEFIYEYYECLSIDGFFQRLKPLASLYKRWGSFYLKMIYKYLWKS